MSIKSFSLISLFIFAALQILLTCFGITLFNTYNDSILKQQSLLEVENVFKMYSAEITGNVLLGNQAIVLARLNEIAANENVAIQISVDNQIRFKSNPLLTTDNTVSATQNLNLGEHVFATMYVQKPIPSLSQKSRTLLLVSSIVPVIFLVLVLLLMHRWTTKNIILPLEHSIKNADNGVNNQTNNSPWIPNEIKRIDQLLHKLILDIKSKSEDKARYELAQQVAHDIRSPITVIEQILKDEKTINENHIILKRATARMQNIARDLLITTQNAESNNLNNSICLVYPAMLDVWNEFNLINSNKNIKGQLNCSADIYKTAIVNADMGQLQRVIVNLINNSIDALKDNTQGQICLELKESPNKDYLRIQITDNGKGIATEHLKNVGTRGFSTKNDKSMNSGSGLGVNYAVTMIDLWNGKFSIDSIEGEGTTINIDLLLNTDFAISDTKLDVTNISKIVLLDDEEINLKYWQEKVNKLNTEGHAISVVSHHSIIEFEEMMPYYQQYLSSMFFIIDHDLGENIINGLGIILKYNLNNHAMVCSNKTFTYHFATELTKNHVQFYPKVLVPDFHLIHKLTNQNLSSQDTQCVLIDDDDLMHAMWDIWAKKNNRRLLMYKNSADLLAELDRFESDADFFIDYHIKGDTMNGGQIAELLHKKGFKNLNICTGDELAFKNKPHYIKSIRGKHVG
jgi:signal transduction histidine kinase